MCAHGLLKLAAFRACETVIRTIFAPWRRARLRKEAELKEEQKCVTIGASIRKDRKKYSNG